MSFLFFLLSKFSLSAHQGFVAFPGSAGDPLNGIDGIFIFTGGTELDPSLGEAMAEAFADGHFRVLCIDEPLDHGSGKSSAFWTTELGNSLILHGQLSGGIFGGNEIDHIIMPVIDDVFL